MHILVDLDDTLADWSWYKDYRLKTDYPHLTGFITGDNVREWDLMHGLDAEHQAAMKELMDSPGFYRNLPVIFGAKQALNDMVAEGHQVTICSTPWITNLTCISDKIAWLEAEIGPGWSKNVAFLSDKTAILGDVLIDDRPSITGSHTPSWRQIIMDKSHNWSVGDALPRLYDWSKWREVVTPTLPPLIGLGGRLRAGKDTVSDYLVERYGFVKIGMSDPLVQALLTLDPMIPIDDTVEWLRVSEFLRRYSYVTAKTNSEVRQLLQRLGTEVGRNILGENTWVDIASKTITELRAEGKPVVITGIRFDNELKMIEKLGGLPVWVERDAGTASAHASENSVSRDDFWVTLLNSGRVSDLYNTLDNFAAAYSLEDWQ